MIPFKRLLLPVLCGLTLVGAAHADEQDELATLRERIAAMQREIERASESESEAADSLRDLERAISNSNRKLAQLADRQRAADKKLEKLQAQKLILSSNMSGQQAMLGGLLYQQYLGGSQEYLRLLLSNQTPDQVSRDLQYYRYIARSRASGLSSLRDDLAALNRLSEAAVEQRSELESLRREQAARKHELEKDRQSHRVLMRKVSSQLRQQRREFSRMQRNESRLSQLVGKLAAVATLPEQSTAPQNGHLLGNRSGRQPFHQLKGKLALPVRGEIANRFDTPRPGSTLVWKGIFLRTSAGQTVKAIAAGRVVFADWLRGFGNMLIIDHGDGYMSLYGNGETLYKQVGDVLSSGDVVAATGNSGGSEEFGLYFELRHKSKPLDPMKWLARK